MEEKPSNEERSLSEMAACLNSDGSEIETRCHPALSGMLDNPIVIGVRYAFRDPQSRFSSEFSGKALQANCMACSSRS